MTDAALTGSDLNSALGIEIDDANDDRVIGHMPIMDRVRQPFGVVHGGAHAAFAETLASVGTYMGVHEDGKIALGMSNQTSFLRSATEGTVHGEAIAIHRGRSVWIWDVTLRDDQERTLAVSRMTIAVREMRKD